MAEEYKDIEKDPLNYIRECYREGERRVDDLKEYNETNRLLYEGIDEDLEDRANDKKVKRSALLVPLLKPAIDTRVAEVLTRVDDRELPVTVRPSGMKPTQDEWIRCQGIERALNIQLRDAGYFPAGFGEHVLGAEIYRTPSVVKVGWMETKQKVARTIQPSPAQYITSVLRTGRIPKSRVEFHDEYNGGKPFVEWLWPDEFLYQPNKSKFEDCEYAIHRIWLSPDELLYRAKMLDYDIEEVKRYCENNKGGFGENDAMADEIEDRRGTGFERSRRDGKIMLTENYCALIDEDGDEVVKLIVALDNKAVIQNKRSPYKGIRFPFVPLIANPLPGTLEGLSSMDLGAPLQTIYNEMFNSYLDGISYRLFPILLKAAGVSFNGKPTISPGAMWEITDMEGVAPLIRDLPTLPDLPSLMEAIAGKLRDSLNAHDISQGFQTQQYEKAASTKLRAMGAATRATPTHKRYAKAAVEVAKMVIALNQQYAPNGVDWVQDVILDVPSLTNVNDPEQEKQDTIMLISQMQASPLYQNPLGVSKIRNAWEDLVRQMKKTDVPRYIPTEQEMTRMQTLQAEAQYYMAQKQSTVEQLGMMQGQENGQEQQAKS